MISSRQLRLLRRRGVKSISGVLAVDFLYRHHGEEITMTELGDFCRVTKGAISLLVDTLVSSGIAERKPIANDRRSTSVRLTKLGVKRWREAA